MATIGIILLTLTYAVCENSNIQRDAVWLESPKITPWGNFGPEIFCPFNGFVTGMRLKMDHKHSGDNTALNGVQLRCSTLDGKHNASITSATGRFGYYGKLKYCPRGFATGFQLRSQNGQGNVRDDVAAVDFKLLCIDNNGGSSQVVDDDNKYLPWGEWTQEQHCPLNTAVCGIATQVENLGKNRKREDETALNNIDIACCPITEPIDACELNFNWETMIACPKEATSCEIKLSTGFADTEQISRFREFYDSMGYIGDFDGFVIKFLKVKAREVQQKVNNQSLERILRGAKINQKKSSFSVKREGIIQQLVVTCGFIKLYEYETRCVPDQYAEQEWASDGLYFRPTSEFETIFWSYNCDFTGGNVANETSNVADCGDICLSNMECTHFVWNKYNRGTCWMKGSLSLPTPAERYNDNFLCGWINRPSSK